MTTTNRSCVALLDISAIIYRAYHAIPPLTAPDGTPVNAVYGMASTILSALSDVGATHAVAAMDTSSPTFRHTLYDQYKATRSAMPDDLRVQMPMVREVLDAFGIPVVSVDGFEADDVIGTLAQCLTQTTESMTVVIITGDHDALQLVSPRISVRLFGRSLRDARIYDANAVHDRYGVWPSQLADFKGLAGDSSDNIPGVRGVGAKTAAALLTKYTDLEGIYDHIEDISGAVHTRLVSARETAFLSRELGRIRTDVPISCTEIPMKYAPENSRLRAYFRAQGFSSLLSRLPKEQMSEEPDPATPFTVCSDGVATLNALASADMVALAPVIKDKILHGVMVSRGDTVEYISLQSAAVQQEFVTFLSSHAAMYIAYDWKAIVRAAQMAGMTLARITPPYSDVLLQAYVLHGGERLSIERVAQIMTGKEISLPNDARAAAALCAHSLPEIYRRATEEIDAVAKTQLPTASVKTVLQELELPLVPILTQMEQTGIAVDTAVLEHVRTELSERVRHAHQAVIDAAGRDFNPNSPSQLAHILFDVLKLPTRGIKKTKRGYSTAARTLELLHDTHPIIAALEEYRQLHKLLTTYVEPLPRVVAEDGRIHTTFQQAVTATGRLSSTDPNLQNIPTRTEDAARIRAAFVPAPGRTFVSWDYSQIDLRCAAHLSRDPVLCAAFKRGEDIHTATAAEVFGIPRAAVDSTLRRRAKALNFGVLYGMGAYGFARSAGISVAEAKDFISRYFERFSGLKSYMDETVEFAHTHGYVQTPFGRRRALPQLHSARDAFVRGAQRQAINMPIQGMAADLMKLAMVRVQECIDRDFASQVAMVLQIHDEILCEVDREHVSEVVSSIRAVMQSVARLRVPLVVDVSCGPSWAEMEMVYNKK